MTDITFGRKKVVFILLYRNPHQTSDEFDLLLDRLQLTVDRIKSLKPHCIVITSDFNCRTKQWWPGDVELLEGSALDEFIASNNVSQLIDEPTNIRTTGMSCINLIITDQLNLFVDFGVHSSPDDHCQHPVFHGKLNISVPLPPPYKRKVWYYAKAQKDRNKSAIANIDWPAMFSGLDVDKMTHSFTSKCASIFSKFIPNKTITCDNRDPPWMTTSLKSAIKRRHRVYNKYVKRGRKPDDWEYVRIIRNQTSSKIAQAKDEYFSSFGKKLSDPTHCTKSYWTTLNKIIDKKKFSNIPPLLENGVFVTYFQTKANILIITLSSNVH